MTNASNRTALVTGGSRGIGFAIALGLGHAGFNVVATGRRPADDVSDAIAEMDAAAASAGARAHYVASDVADLEQHRELVGMCIDRFGAIDVLVNNAGVAPAQRADILEADPDSYDRVMSINLRGPYFLTQHVARRMIDQISGGRVPGTIIHVSSISAVVASPNRGEYCISKAGQAMASSLWAVRLAEFGIGVFDVRPGVIETDMTEGVLDKYNKMVRDGLTLQPRLGKPEDVARAVTMLARGDLAYSTGQVLYVDGGMLVHRL